MSVTTSCNTYFVSALSSVTSNSTNPATCDSTLTTCTITTPSGNTVSLTCNSQLHSNPNYGDSTASDYFCGCGGTAPSVPEGVNCAGFCYKLSTTYHCSSLTLYDGGLVGNLHVAITGNECDDLNCDEAGKICTSDEYSSYECDNIEHLLPGTSATRSYVCNCAGPAAIPLLYQSDGQTLGKTCGNGDSAAGTSTAPAAATSTAVIATSSTLSGGNADETPTASPSGNTSRGNVCSLKKALLAVPLLLIFGLGV